MPGDRIRWCVTINNWSVADLQQLRLCENVFRMAQGQFEIGVDGTPHIQAWFLLLVPHTLSWLKNNVHPTAHFEMMKGTLSDNLKYCTKDETRDPMNSSIWYYPNEEIVRHQCLSKSTVSLSSLVKQKLIDPFSVLVEDSYIRNKRNIDDVVLETRKKLKIDALVESYGSVQLKPWQQLLELLLFKQTSRHVYWVYDEIGNVGKSWFAGFLIAKYNYMDLKAKTSSETIGHMIVDQDPPGLIFDIPRDETTISWSSIEHYKNGRISTTKYHGYSGPIGSKKVIFFANFYPKDLSVLSQDRWKIYFIKNDLLFFTS